jgi:hypothetical protein
MSMQNASLSTSPGKRDGSGLIAGMNVNVWDVNEHVQALIRSRQPIQIAALRDPDIALESLTK